ncbi:hypothetical protein Tco_0357311 [Tanacetum coccineum]
MAPNPEGVASPHNQVGSSPEGNGTLPFTHAGGNPYRPRQDSNMRPCLGGKKVVSLEEIKGESNVDKKKGESGDDGGEREGELKLENGKSNLQPDALLDQEIEKLQFQVSIVDVCSLGVQLSMPCLLLICIVVISCAHR